MAPGGRRSRSSWMPGNSRRYQTGSDAAQATLGNHLPVGIRGYGGELKVVADIADVTGTWKLYCA